MPNQESSRISNFTASASFLREVKSALVYKNAHLTTAMHALQLEVARLSELAEHESERVCLNCAHATPHTELDDDHAYNFCGWRRTDAGGENFAFVCQCTVPDFGTLPEVPAP